MAPTGQQYDNKTGQWFGSLVRSSGEDGVVLVRLFILIDTLISKISRLDRKMKTLVCVYICYFYIFKCINGN